ARIARSNACAGHVVVMEGTMKYDPDKAVLDHAMQVWTDRKSSPEDREAARKQLIRGRIGRLISTASRSQRDASFSTRSTSCSAVAKTGRSAGVRIAARSRSCSREP